MKKKEMIDVYVVLLYCDFYLIYFNGRFTNLNKLI